MNKTKIVQFPAKVLYILSFVIPVTSVFVAITIHYSLRHNKGTPATIMTISESVVDLPESRVFNIGMTFGAMLQFAIYFMRHHYLVTIVRRDSKFILRLLKWIVILCEFLGPFTFIGIGNFTVKEFTNAHNSFAIIFFYSVCLYFIFYDIILMCTTKKLKWYSGMLSYLMLITTLLAGWVRFAVPLSNDAGVSASSVFEYITVVIFGLKCCLTIIDLPPHGIKFFSK